MKQISLFVIIILTFNLNLNAQSQTKDSSASWHKLSPTYKEWQKIEKDSKTKFFQTVLGGFITGVSSTNYFVGDKDPFQMSYTLLGDVVIVTPITYHCLIYGFPDNSARFLSGYFLPKNWDAYFVYSKTLSENKNYLGVGVEKMLKADQMNCFLFAEFGVIQGSGSICTGILFSLQNKIWKRRK